MLGLATVICHRALVVGLDTDDKRSQHPFEHNPGQQYAHDEEAQGYRRSKQKERDDSSGGYQWAHPHSVKGDVVHPVLRAANGTVVRVVQEAVADPEDVDR